MGEFYQQVLTVLTTSPGNLAYHLVLAFSIASALLASVNLGRRGENLPNNRMLLGFVLLLGLRFVLFISAGLAWQGVSDPNTLLPVIDRAVTAISIVLIIWMWTFPMRSRQADAATGLLSLIIVTAFTLTVIWWGGQPATTFNASWLDVGWEILTLFLITMGAILLIIRRSHGWGLGVAMLVIVFCGHLLHIISPLDGSNFPGAVRLAQMAAYPLLIALATRFGQQTELPQPVELEPSFQDDLHLTTDPRIIEAAFSIASQGSFADICNSLTRTIASALVADICLVLNHPESADQLTIQCGYDLIQEEEIPSLSLDIIRVPLLYKAIQDMNPIRLPPSTDSLDITSLNQALGRGRGGHLMAAFVPGEEDKPLLGIVLMSPYTNRSWTKEDQNHFVAIANSLTGILQPATQQAAFQDEVDQYRRNIKETQILLEETQNENLGLRAELSRLSEQVLKRKTRSENLEALIATQEESQQIIAYLRTENSRLEALANNMMADMGAEKTTDSQVEEELRLALEELARLNARLAQADQQLIQSEDDDTHDYALSDDQLSGFATIAQDLRQPMSSIVGYTDLLLGESVGILGALQRKFLERVKVSTERMEGLLDDLLHITALDSGKLEIITESVDLNLVIDEAITSTSANLREKNITLRVDLPTQFPLLRADPDAIHQVIVNLLKNAGLATPAEGEISLRASVHRGEEGEDFALIQITDQGGGIPSEDLPRVFSRLYRAESTLVQGVGDTGVGLAVAKTLVEAHNGRIWIDAEMGVSSTFSVLIPLRQAEAEADGQEG
jgi:signal transduction histidine kinase